MARRDGVSGADTGARRTLQLVNRRDCTVAQVSLAANLPPGLARAAPRTLTELPRMADRYPLADRCGNYLEVCGAVSTGQRSIGRTLHHDTTSFVYRSR
jgi:hypothetical protein